MLSLNCLFSNIECKSKFCSFDLLNIFMIWQSSTLVLLMSTHTETHELKVYNNIKTRSWSFFVYHFWQLDVKLAILSPTNVTYNKCGSDYQGHKFPVSQGAIVCSNTLNYSYDCKSLSIYQSLTWRFHLKFKCQWLFWNQMKNFFQCSVLVLWIRKRTEV